MNVFAFEECVCYSQLIYCWIFYKCPSILTAFSPFLPSTIFTGLFPTLAFTSPSIKRKQFLLIFCSTYHNLSKNVCLSSACPSSSEYVPIVHIQGSFYTVPLLTGSRSCASQRPVNRRLRNAFQFFPMN